MSNLTNYVSGMSPASNNMAASAFANPVIPNQIPTAGLAKGYASLQQSNPITDAIAGPKCNLIWVDAIDKILAHPTSPDEHLYFGDKNEQIIYLRETDASGKIKNPLKALHYTIEEIPFGPEAQFVTKDEHKQLFDLVSKLSQNVDSMNGKLEQLLNG